MTNFYSQQGQDKYVATKFFPHLRYGVFIDIGAHDGKTYSNTLHFEKKGWTGICVEPLPSVFKVLKTTRQCICVNAAIDIVNGETNFVSNTGYTEMLSGIEKYYPEKHHARRLKEQRIMGGSTEIIKVPTIRLDTLLEKHGINRVDYLNVDVEGGEYEVIKSIDFNTVDIHVIGFEDNYQENSASIISYLTTKGYQYDSRTGGDIFMVKKSIYYKK
jgi:FkbM family methyltransferase